MLQITNCKLQITNRKLSFTVYHLPFAICYLLFAICCLLFASPVFAQSPDAQVKFFITSPEPGQTLTVGDRIILRLEVNHPANSRVNLPKLDKQWEKFEVLDQSPPQDAPGSGGTVTTGQNIVVTLFEPGQYQTPALVVTHQKPDGAIEELAAPVIPLKVTSVLTEDKELRDIKPQVDLPVPPLWPWIVLGVWLALVLAVALTLLGMWLYRRWPRRLRPEETAEDVVIDPRPPEEIAHAELNRIESLNLPAQGRVKEHYSLVADCLRLYIEGRYRIPALEQTTGEIQVAFKKAKTPPREAAAFSTLFTDSDLVKFARYMPQADEAAGLVNRARTIVDATTPAPETEETA
jgi:hypothetical protein